MKRSLAFLAAIGLFACATSVAPPNDGVIMGSGVEAGDEGNPYGGDGGSEAGDPLADSGQVQEAASTDTGTPADSAVDTGPVSTGGVCSKTTIQRAEYAAAVLGGGVDCSAGPSVCASGQCCYQTSVLSLCVGQ